MEQRFRTEPVGAACESSIGDATGDRTDGTRSLYGGGAIKIDFMLDLEVNTEAFTPWGGHFTGPFAERRVDAVSPRVECEVQGIVENESDGAGCGQ